MANPFDQFDAGNPFDQFDGKPKPIGQAANADFLRAELQNADPFKRNLAGAGVALSDTWEGLKQFFGGGDKDRIEANKVIAKEAPVGNIVGNVALTAIPFSAVGTGVRAAAATGAVMGALQPGEGESYGDVLASKAKHALTDAALSGVGQGVANAGAKWFEGKAADLALQKSINAPRDETLKGAVDANLGVVPSEASPTWWSNLLETFGGKSATAKTQALANAERIPALAREDLHLPDNAALTPSAFQQARNNAYDVAYKPVVNTPSITNDQAFLQDLAKASPVGKGGAVVNPGAEDAQALLTNLAKRGEWTGQQLMADVKALRQQASADFGSAARDGGDVAKETLARTKRQAADALEELAGRQVGGDAINLMREARQYIARSHSWEDALVNGSGQINPAVLARMFDNQVPLSGNAKVVGAAANVFPRSFQNPTRATGADVSVLNTMAGMAGGSALGEMADHGVLGGMAGPLALALARKGARSAVLSRASKNALLNTYRMGAPSVAANRLLQYAPVGGAVLGTESFP